MNPTVSDRIAGSTAGQLQLAQGRIERREQHVPRQNLGVGQAVEQRRLAGVGVTDQGDRRIRHALSRQALQSAGAAHVGELGLQGDDTIDQQTPVGLNLGFTRSAEETEAAALAFEVGPGADQTRALIVEPGQFDLQAAFARAGAAAKDLQDKTCAVDDLNPPGPFQVALLDGRQSVVDGDEINALFLANRRDLLDLALAEQSRRQGGAQWRDQTVPDIQFERSGQSDGFFETRGRRTRPRALMRRVDDHRRLGGYPLVDGS